MDNRFYRTKEGADYIAALEALALELAGALDTAVLCMEEHDRNCNAGHEFHDHDGDDCALCVSCAALSSPLLADLRAKEEHDAVDDLLDWENDFRNGRAKEDGRPSRWCYHDGTPMEWTGSMYQCPKCDGTMATDVEPKEDGR